MKEILLSVLKIYKIVLSPIISTVFPYYGCRFWPTCSDYTYKAVETLGVVKGSFMGIKRVIRCSPFSKGGADYINIYHKI